MPCNLVGCFVHEIFGSKTYSKTVTIITKQRQVEIDQELRNEVNNGSELLRHGFADMTFNLRLNRLGGCIPNRQNRKKTRQVQSNVKFMFFNFNGLV